MDLNLNVDALDLEAGEKGVWLDYDDGISFLIARANTPAFRGAVKRVQKIHGRQIEMDTLSDKKADALASEIMADHILKGWEGLKNNGEDFQYNRENCVAFLSDERYLEIRRWIMQQASDMENYRASQLKE